MSATELRLAAGGLVAAVRRSLRAALHLGKRGEGLYGVEEDSEGSETRAPYSAAPVREGRRLSAMESISEHEKVQLETDGLAESVGNRLQSDFAPSVAALVSVAQRLRRAGVCRAVDLRAEGRDSRDDEEDREDGGNDTEMHVPLQSLAQAPVRTCHASTPWRCVHAVPRVSSASFGGVDALSAWVRPLVSKFGFRPEDVVPWEQQPERPFLFFLHIPKTAGTSMNFQMGLLFPHFASCNLWRNIPFNGARAVAKQLFRDVERNGVPDCDVFSHELKWNDTLSFLGRSSEAREPDSGKEYFHSPRSALVLTMNRDPVQRTVSFMRHHMRSDGPEYTLDRAVHSPRRFQRARRSAMQSFSDSGDGDAALVAADRALASFWQGITEMSELSFCILAIQTRHPNWKEVCTCTTAMPGAKPFVLNQNNEGNQRVSVDNLKHIFDTTAKERLSHVLMTHALWERAEAVRAAYPSLPIECLAFGHVPTSTPS
jgi:hypothetical protein